VHATSVQHPRPALQLLGAIQWLEPYKWKKTASRTGPSESRSPGTWQEGTTAPLIAPKRPRNHATDTPRHKKQRATNQPAQSLTSRKR